MLMNLILVADWLGDIIAIHRGLHREGDIIEIIPAHWHHKQNLNIFMFKLFLFCHKPVLTKANRILTYLD